jgi:hypothetical protein
MKCPECIKENKKSCVSAHGGSTTLLYCEPWYDEEGKYHHHDWNTITSSYSCSNGHKWTEQRKAACPTCGNSWWKNK